MATQSVMIGCRDRHRIPACCNPSDGLQIRGEVTRLHRGRSVPVKGIADDSKDDDGYRSHRGNPCGLRPPPHRATSSLKNPLEQTSGHGCLAQRATHCLIARAVLSEPLCEFGVTLHLLECLPEVRLLRVY